MRGNGSITNEAVLLGTAPRLKTAIADVGCNQPIIWMGTQAGSLHGRLEECSGLTRLCDLVKQGSTPARARHASGASA